MSTPAPRRVPTRRRPRRPAWQRLLIAGAGVLAVLLGGSVVLSLSSSGKARAGTKIGDESVGGKSAAEVRAVVERLTSADRRLTLTMPGRTFQVSVGGAGLTTNVQATVDRAMRSGRGGLLSPIGSLLGSRQVPLVATIDDAALRQTVADVAGAVDRDPFAGGLAIDPSTLVAEVLPARGGRTVRQRALAARLRDRLLHPGPTTVAVPLTQGARVPSDQLQRIARQAEQYLRRPLTLTGAGKPYVVSPAALAPVLAVESTGGGTGARLGVKRSSVAELAARVARLRDRAPKSATISAPARGPIVDGKADVSWKPRAATVRVGAEGRDGLAVNQRTLAARIRSAVHSGAHTAAIPTAASTPPVSRRTAREISHVIGTFTTYYVPGQPRVTNIQRIARSIDGTVIAPGAQFSLNGLAGERTTAKGYVEAPFIAGNKIEPSVGGGVSQFSTTMFNAAYFAGLQLDAYQAHSLFIDRYPAGRDTTLNWPTIDLKWTNDTKAPVFIRAYTDSAGVTVTLYGNNDNRRVQADPGEREPNPGGNFKITITRVITYPDGRVVRQPHTTAYANEVTDGGPPQE